MVINCCSGEYEGTRILMIKGAATINSADTIAAPIVRKVIAFVANSFSCLFCLR